MTPDVMLICNEATSLLTHQFGPGLAVIDISVSRSMNDSVATVEYQAYHAIPGLSATHSTIGAAIAELLSRSDKDAMLAEASDLEDRAKAIRKTVEAMP